MDSADECFTKLFEKLSFTDQLSARLVCKLWMNILDEPHFSDKRVLVLDGMQDLKTLASYPSKYFKRVRLGPNYGADTKLNEEEQLFQTYGKYVEFLDTRKMIEKRGLREFCTIKEFSCYEANSIERYELPVTVKTIYMEVAHTRILTDALTFLVNMTNLEQIITTKISMAPVSPDYTTFVRVSFQLKDYLKRTNVKKIEIQPRDILKNIAFVNPSDVVSFCDIRYPVVEFPIKDFQIFTNLRTFPVLVALNRQSCCFFVHNTCVMKSITELSIDLGHIQPPVCKTCLTNLKTCCPNITTWNVASANVQEFFVALKKLEKPMRRLRIHHTNMKKSEESPDTTFGYWSLRNYLGSLEELKMSCGSAQQFVSTIRTWPMVFPKMRFLDLDFQELSENDKELIKEKFPNVIIVL